MLWQHAKFTAEEPIRRSIGRITREIQNLDRQEQEQDMMTVDRNTEAGAMMEISRNMSYVVDFRNGSPAPAD
jgi:hypothetical protein